MSNFSPYRQLCLRRNPFGEFSKEERVQLAIVDSGPWLSWLEQPTAALQFIGPCGHGKTTHLLAIQSQWPHSQYVYFPEDGPPPALPTSSRRLIDEAQRMPWRQWRQTLRRGGPVVLGTHADHTVRLQRAGFQVRTVHVAEMTSPQRLAEMLNRRMEFCRLGSRSLPRFTQRETVWLRQRFGNNIRAIEHFLYEQVQRCIREQSLWPLVNFTFN